MPTPTPVPSDPPIPDPIIEPIKPVEPEPIPELVEKVWTAKDHLDAMGDIIRECDGIESNVGMTSPYWDHQREYRRLTAK